MAAISFVSKRQCAENEECAPFPISTALELSTLRGLLNICCEGRQATRCLRVRAAGRGGEGGVPLQDPPDRVPPEPHARAPLLLPANPHSGGVGSGDARGTAAAPSTPSPFLAERSGRISSICQLGTKPRRVASSRKNRLGLECQLWVRILTLQLTCARVDEDNFTNGHGGGSCRPSHVTARGARCLHRDVEERV